MNGAIATGATGHLPRIALGAAVHVWQARTECCDTPERRAYYTALLSDDERARLQALAFDHLRMEFLLTRALCRTALSAHAGVAPANWRFVRRQGGRPAIADPHAALDLAFNLSNCATRVVCAVAAQTEVGVDIEQIASFRQEHDIVPQCLSERESAWLYAQPVSMRARSLCMLWTLKESYVKARGLGLAVPLRLCRFDLDGGRIVLELDPALNDDASSWHFQTWQPDAHHCAALALRCRGNARLQVQWHDVTPDPGDHAYV
ncbi:MAG: 4'-phosphopantetheinyl transferase superfamily protein [Xanthomonas sp.]